MIDVLNFECFKNIILFYNLKHPKVPKLQTFRVTGMSCTPKVFYIIFMMEVISRLTIF